MRSARRRSRWAAAMQRGDGIELGKDAGIVDKLVVRVRTHVAPIAAFCNVESLTEVLSGLLLPPAGSAEWRGRALPVPVLPAPLRFGDRAHRRRHCRAKGGR